MLLSSSLLSPLKPDAPIKAAATPSLRATRARLSVSCLVTRTANNAQRQICSQQAAHPAACFASVAGVSGPCRGPRPANELRRRRRRSRSHRSPGWPEIESGHGGASPQEKASPKPEAEPVDTTWSEGEWAQWQADGRAKSSWTAAGVDGGGAGVAGGLDEEAASWNDVRAPPDLPLRARHIRPSNKCQHTPTLRRPTRLPGLTRGGTARTRGRWTRRTRRR